MAERKSSIILELKNRIGGPLRQMRKQVTRATADVRAKFASVGRQARRLGVGVGVAAIGVGAALTKITFDTAKSGDNIAKFADQIGLSISALQEYRFAAERQGVSQSIFDQSLGAFSKRLGEARNGTGALTTYLKKANPELLKQLTTTSNLDDAFRLYLDALAQTKNPMDQAAGASAAFSRAGLAMIRITRDGSDNIDNLRKQAHRLGLVMSDEAARGAEGFEDSLTNVQSAISGVKTIIGSALMPAIQNTMDRITKLVVDNRQEIARWSQQFAQKLPGQIEHTVTAIRDSVQTIQNIVDMIGGWKVALGGVIAIMSAPLLLAVGGAIAAVIKLGAVIGRTKAAKSLFNKAFALNPLGSPISGSRWGKWLNRAGAVATAGVIGWAIGSEINKKIDGTHIGDAIGKSVTQTLAFFGNDNAQAALDANDISKGGVSSGKAAQLAAELKRRQAEERAKQARGEASAYDYIPGGRSKTAGQTQQTNVGGTLRIQIDSMGRPQVRDVRRDGPMDIDVDSGPLIFGN